jgi:hypothetical protein
MRILIWKSLSYTFLFSSFLTGPITLAQNPSDAMRKEFEGWVQSVTTSDAHEYNATDSAGNPMDTAKIIADPAGGYLAIYHTEEASGTFIVYLATSTDLMHWTYQAQLGTNASQPYITYLPDGGFVTAWEQTPNNHIHFNYYASRAALLVGTAAKTFDAPMTLSTCAEGTPSIYSATLSPNINQSTLDVGGHFYDNCVADREQRGTLTNFESWTTSVQTGLNNALLAFGPEGNIGERDALNYRGFSLGLIEGQFTSGDWGSWRIFCYDYQTGNADELNIVTDGGSQSFGGPKVTNIIAPNGKPAIVVTLFVFGQNNAPGEAGELIYYKTYDFSTPGGAVPVSLDSFYNRTGIVSDGTTFEGGLDGSGNAYANYLLGSLPGWNMPSFQLGPVDSPNVASAAGSNIALPQGQFATLQMLGTGVNGAQPNQTVKITYTDSSTSTLTQGLSDWSVPQNFLGESAALAMAYRDGGSGDPEKQTTYLYRYLFGLDSTKTVSSVTLPADDDMEVLALTLVPATGANFSLTSDASTLTVGQGDTTTSTVTLTPSVAGGFTQPVSLACGIAPAGAACSISPESITPTFAKTATLSIQAISSTALGPATVTVTGTSGNLQQAATLGLTVTPPETYSLSAGTPAPVSISPGGTSETQVTLNSKYGYTGSVALGCAVTSTASFNGDEAVCSFGGTSPVAVSAAGGVATMTFYTEASSASSMRAPRIFGGPLLPVLGIFLVALAWSCASPTSRNSRGAGILLRGALLGTALILPACGGGSPAGVGIKPAATPAGTYTITITARDASGAGPTNTSPVALTIEVN